jgi:replicative DNA helicase
MSESGVPTSDLDAEAAVLSAVLLDPSTLPKIESLEPRHFYADANRHIFRAVGEVARSGRPVDVVTVSGYLRDRERLQQIGGSPYLAQLSDATPAVAHVAAHADRVIACWRQREVLRIAQQLAAEAKGDVGEIGPWLEGYRAQLSEVAQSNRPPVAQTGVGVIDEWSCAGPLMHEPTGIARLDELTGGGPVYGTRWYVAGAPDAAKTLLLLQIAHTYAARGITVGLLAVDEEPGDMVTRIAQRLGYARHHCEARDPAVLAELRAALEALPLHFYDSSWTIEAAAEDVARQAATRGSRAMLGIDSVQTVRCAAESAPVSAGRELSEVAAVTARVHAIRAVATRHQLIAIATSELGRGSYKSSDPALQTSTLASAKWSGAIEYSARVLLGLRSVPDQPDLVELELAKNKHGPRDERLHLRIDRRGQTLREVAYEPPPAPTAADRDTAAKSRVIADAVAVARVLLTSPGQTVRQLRGAACAATGMGNARTDAAVALLGEAVIRGSGPRGAMPMSLDASRLSAAVRAGLESTP